MVLNLITRFHQIRRNAAPDAPWCPGSGQAFPPRSRLSLSALLDEFLHLGDSFSKTPPFIVTNVRINFLCLGGRVGRAELV